MSTPLPPGPPKVHAPHRASAEGTSSDAALTAAGPASGVAGTGTGSTTPTKQGATVTASVGGAQNPPAAPGVPTTKVPTQSAPVPPGELARTGMDVGLVLVFALLAVLIGFLLVRLGSPRTGPSTTHEGAPCTPPAR